MPDSYPGKGKLNLNEKEMVEMVPICLTVQILI